MKRLDLVGDKFGKLTVLSLVGYKGYRGWWEVKCDCGSKLVVKTGDLRSGNTKSCGCYRVTHGCSKSTLYKVWTGMKGRCSNPKCPTYKYYGGRGIKVCERWNTSFEAFKEDMSPTYKKGLELDRIDTNGDYSPENCHWVTKYENLTNQRRTRRIDGLTISELSKKYGIHRDTIAYRFRQGKSLEEITNTNFKRKPKVND